MTEEEHLWVCLNEELVEIAKIVSKILRFGLHDVYPPQEGNADNAALLHGELHDLCGVLDELEARGIFTHVIEQNLIANKRAKIKTFIKYARERGTITDGGEKCEGERNK